MNALRRLIAGVAAAWQGASPTGRGQAAAAAMAAAGVIGVFAYGAATRATPPAPRTPATVVAAATGQHRARTLHGPLPAPPATGPRAATPQPAAGVSATGAPTPSSGAAPGRPRTRPRSPHRGVVHRHPSAHPSSDGFPVTVALLYRPSTGLAGLDAALGVRQAPGDAAGQARAVAGWIDAHGGIGGRRLALDLFPYEPEGALSYASAFDGACSLAAAANPRPVVVFGLVEQADVQADCLAHQGLTMLGDGPAPGDTDTFARAGDHLFAPGGMSLDRLAGAEVQELAAEGALPSGVRVGIVRLDQGPFERAAARTLRPALAARGARVVAEEPLAFDGTAADAAALASRSTRAAVDLEAARAQLVVVLDDGGVLSPALMRAASQVGYHPRYALNSTMTPASLPGAVPADELSGATGVGSAPLLDVGAGQEPAAPSSLTRCRQIYGDSHIDPGPRTIDGAYAAFALCDDLLRVRAAVVAGGDASPDGARRGLLEGRPVPAVALDGALGGARHDGARSVRPLAYRPDCGCMRYVGPRRPA